MMLKLKRLLIWCTRHRAATQSRRRQPNRQDQQNSADDGRQSQQRQRLGGRLFGRRAAVSMDEPRQRRRSSDRNLSSETLVDEKHRARAFSDPAISEYQHVYSYYPWSESEHEEILSRSPPPLRPHYATFPSLVEMGGFLSI
ncbi:hypothetical protein LPJ56_002039 [Coemansia sp. RSA 2599]|nr:hypothetical protein LPJ75_001664 [Coemansia sp. RSA 2598]KAJ1826727.1 hypothetical protein LPJ56_002039 [Coemansia sp. RSA 2599]